MAAERCEGFISVLRVVANASEAAGSSDWAPRGAARARVETIASTPTVCVTIVVTPSLDDLIGAKDQRLGNGEAQRFRRSQVQHELVLARLLDGQIPGPGALEYPVHIGAGASEEVVEVRAIRQEGSGLDH